jgi:hypothetical protein
MSQTVVTCYLDRRLKSPGWPEDIEYDYQCLVVVRFMPRAG